jgi:hypothetical protein
MLAVTIFLVALSIAAALFNGYMMHAGSGLGTLGVLAFMITVVPTLICAMVTGTIWFFQRNRSISESISIVESKSDNKH